MRKERVTNLRTSGERRGGSFPIIPIMLIGIVVICTAIGSDIFLENSLQMEVEDRRLRDSAQVAQLNRIMKTKADIDLMIERIREIRNEIKTELILSEGEVIEDNGTYTLIEYEDEIYIKECKILGL